MGLSSAEVLHKLYMAAVPVCLKNQGILTDKLRISIKVHIRQDITSPERTLAHFGHCSR